MKARGFTLLEVLVALLVAALALTAASKAVSMAVDGEAASQSHTLALWVAENRLADLQSAPSLPGVGTSEGSEQQAGQDFHWRLEVTATPNARFRKASVSVYQSDRPDYALARLSGYVAGK